MYIIGTRINQLFYLIFYLFSALARPRIVPAHAKQNAEYRIPEIPTIINSHPSSNMIYSHNTHRQETLYNRRLIEGRKKKKRKMEIYTISRTHLQLIYRKYRGLPVILPSVMNLRVEIYFLSRLYCCNM